MKFAINDIIVGNRMRSVGDVSDLIESIKNIGLMNPITVVIQKKEVGGLTKDTAPILVAGQRRLQACKDLGWEEISTEVIELYDLDLEIAEIDENLIRKDLTALERKEQIARRKWIYEQKYPEARAGVAGGLARQNSATAKISAAESIAETTGYTDRSVRSDVHTIKHIPKEIRDQIRETPMADSDSDLRALARADPVVQRQAVNEYQQGEVSNLREFLNKKETPKLTEVDIALDKLAFLLVDNADEAIKHLKTLKPKAPILGKLIWRIKNS